MSRESAQVDATAKRSLLQLLQISIRFVFHLFMQDFNAVKAHIGRQIDAILDIPEGFVFKLPERVG